jgi:hypothetical protein
LREPREVREEDGDEPALLRLFLHGIALNDSGGVVRFLRIFGYAVRGQFAPSPSGQIRRSCAKSAPA